MTVSRLSQVRTRGVQRGRRLCTTRWSVAMLALAALVQGVESKRWLSCDFHASVLLTFRLSILFNFSSSPTITSESAVLVFARCTPMHKPWQCSNCDLINSWFYSCFRNRYGPVLRDLFTNKASRSTKPKLLSYRWPPNLVDSQSMPPSKRRNTLFDGRVRGAGVADGVPPPLGVGWRGMVCEPAMAWRQQ